MRKRTNRSRGLTLVEMLLVLAIIGIISAISIPTLAKMGAFSRDTLGSSARSVLQTLTVARLYAQQARADTAVVYTLKTVKDSRDETTDQLIADGVGIARKMTDAEVRDILGVSPLSEQGKRAYVMVDDSKADFVLLKKGACIEAQVDVAGSGAVSDWASRLLSDQLFGEETSGASRQGLCLVQVYPRLSELDAYGASYGPMPPRVEPPTDFGLSLSLPDLYPAHVFRPSGELKDDTGNAAVAYRVRIGVSPDDEVSERFMDADKTDYEESYAYAAGDPLNLDDPGRYDDASVPDVSVAAVVIELSKLSGRVAIGDEM